MDEYDYIMCVFLRVASDECRYGKVYKFDEDSKDRVTAYASYGGLLMALSGSYRHVNQISVGQPIYLLIRKHTAYIARCSPNLTHAGEYRRLHVTPVHYWMVAELATFLLLVSRVSTDCRLV